MKNKELVTIQDIQDRHGSYAVFRETSPNVYAFDESETDDLEESLYDDWADDPAAVGDDDLWTV